MEPWVQLLVQVPLVAAFMWFVLTWSARLDSQQEKRESQWRQFLTDQREVTIAALSDVSKQLQGVGDRLDEMHISLVKHDSSAQQAIDAAQAAVLEMRMTRGTKPLPVAAT